MKYYTHQERKAGFKDFLQLIRKKKEKPEPVKLTVLDKAILRRTNTGADILSIIGVGKPYVNQYGTKTFATTEEIKSRVFRLVNKGLLERR